MAFQNHRNRKERSRGRRLPSERPAGQEAQAGGQWTQDPRTRRVVMTQRDGYARRILSYRDRQRFPESNSAYRQLQLLLAGSMPLLRQRARGLMYRVRSAISEFVTRTRRTSEPKRVNAAVFLAASLAIAVFAVFQVLYTTATTVAYDGVDLGTVASEAEAQAAFLSVERSISDAIGSDYTVEPSRVS